MSHQKLGLQVNKFVNKVNQDFSELDEFQRSNLKNSSGNPDLSYAGYDKKVSPDDF